MYLFPENTCEGIAVSDQLVYARRKPDKRNTQNHFRTLVYPDIYILDRGTAYRLSVLGDDSDEAKKLKAEVKEYNKYCRELEDIPGFKAFFYDHERCVTKNDVAKEWSPETADRVFSLQQYRFQTDLVISEDFLFDCSAEAVYEATIGEETITLPIGGSSDRYPQKIGTDKVIWNYVNNGRDFLYFLWELLSEEMPQHQDDDAPACAFEVYDQVRHDGTLEYPFVRIFKKLESLGYLRTFTIRPEIDDPRWQWFGKKDGSIDAALLDLRFLKNKLLREQIELLMKTDESELKQKKYFLTDRNGRQYLSAKPGAFGGHQKLGIYGKMDCPSANRYIQKGQYVQHRVFFPDQETAVAAGYRPCGVCMKKEYKAWKEKNKKKNE